MFIGLFLASYFTFANVYFLFVNGFRQLPYAFIVGGSVGLVTALGFQKWKIKLNNNVVFVRNCFAVLCLITLIQILFFQLPNLTSDLLRSYFSFIWIGTIYGATSMGFSTLFLTTFSFEQSKKYFGILSSGETVASIIMFLSLSKFGDQLPERYYILFFAFVGILVATILVHYKRHATSVALQDNDDANDEVLSERTEELQHSSKAYKKSLIIVAFISVVVAYLADYGFLASTKTLSDAFDLKVVGIIGVFYGIVKVLELAFSWISGSVMVRQGVPFTNLSNAFTITCILCLGFITLAFLQFQDSPNKSVIAAFIILGMARGVDRIFRRAFEFPSARILLFLIPRELRSNLQSAIDVIYKQISIVVAGVIAMIYNVVSSGADVVTSMLILTVLLSFLSMTWLLVVFRQNKLYKYQLIAHTLDIHNSAAVKPRKERNSNFENGLFIDFLEGKNHLASINNLINVLNLHKGKDAVKFLSHGDPYLELIATDKIIDSSTQEEGIQSSLRAGVNNNCKKICDFIVLKNALKALHKSQDLDNAFNRQILLHKEIVINILSKLYDDYHLMKIKPYLLSDDDPERSILAFEYLFNTVSFEDKYVVDVMKSKGKIIHERSILREFPINKRVGVQRFIEELRKPNPQIGLALKVDIVEFLRKSETPVLFDTVSHELEQSSSPLIRSAVIAQGLNVFDSSTDEIQTLRILEKQPLFESFPRELLYRVLDLYLIQGNELLFMESDFTEPIEIIDNDVIIRFEGWNENIGEDTSTQSRFGKLPGFKPYLEFLKIYSKEYNTIITRLN